MNTLKFIAEAVLLFVACAILLIIFLLFAPNQPLW
jgi:hypothetical protein